MEINQAQQNEPSLWMHILLDIYKLSCNIQVPKTGSILLDLIILRLPSECQWQLSQTQTMTLQQIPLCVTDLCMLEGSTLYA